jgi:hypothetical protein
MQNLSVQDNRDFLVEHLHALSKLPAGSEIGGRYEAPSGFVAGLDVPIFGLGNSGGDLYPPPVSFVFSQVYLGCRQRRPRVPVPPASPGTRSPPGDAETDLRTARWPEDWRRASASKGDGSAGLMVSVPDRLDVLRD